ncbi:MAG: DUF2169 domain-containing protein [Chloroflexi bacterium]|nr:DUF2169 domain-containing protein [Chloroflexota bacterium]
METVFPEDDGYEGFFLVGNRKNPDGGTAIQTTGTVVLKRTYDINPVTAQLTPSAGLLPVFMKDQRDNLLLNSHFESDLLDGEGNPIDWQPEGVTIATVPDPADSENHFMQVAGNADGRVVQTITVDEPLGGQTFTFSFWAISDANAEIQDARLEADGENGLVTICSIDVSLTNLSMSRRETTGTWPFDLTATEMRVVLRMADDSNRTVFYDNVQVEKRGYGTVWNPDTTMYFEHDLAAYKPEGDVVVLGYAGVSGINRVKIAGSTWMERNVTTTAPPEKALFGWEPRVGSERETEAGTYDPPPDDPLPADFENRFYNGYRRTNLVQGITANAPFPFLPAAALVEINRNGSVDYRFNLRGDTAVATFYIYGGAGSDDESNWQDYAVPMNLDTLVIEPEKHRCYLVWRGVWSFDEHEMNAYRRLTVEASA